MRQKLFIALVFFFSLLMKCSSADEAYVTAQGADVVDIIDLASMKTLTSLPIGGKVAGVAMSKNGAHAYVTSPEGRYLTVIDTQLRRIEKKIPVNGAPLGVTVTDDEAFAYVCDVYGGQLIELDVRSGHQRNLHVGAMPSGLALTPDGKTLIVSVRDDNSLAIIDTQGFYIRHLLAVGAHPYGLSIDKNGAWVYSANV